MASILDIIGSTMFVGILIISILTINNNMVMGNAKSISTYLIQSQTQELARIVENDVYKMGFRVYGNEVLFGDSSQLRFRADLSNNGTINTVEYILGDRISESANPNDRKLSRIVDGSTLFISFNATRFYIQYFDSAMQKLTTPLSVADLKRVRTVNILLALQTPDPVDFYRKAGTGELCPVYGSAHYEKLISAQNLSF